MIREVVCHIIKARLIEKEHGNVEQQRIMPAAQSYVEIHLFIDDRAVTIRHPMKTWREWYAERAEKDNKND